MADSFLVLVPHKTLHGTISILIQRPKLATNVGKMGAVKNKMPFIPQCPGPAQSAAAEMPGDGRFSKPTLFHRQGMRPHAELHQQPDEECSDPIEDEHHAIFDCSAYADAREQYRDLFQVHITTVGDFLNQPQCNRLAKFPTWIRMLRMNRA